MFNCICTCLCVLMIAEPLVALGSVIIDTPNDGTFLTESSARHRTKRWSPVAALIRSAKLISSRQGYSVFQKSGGASQAKKDFQSLSPKYVGDQWNRQYGELGDIDVFRSSLDGKPSLTLGTWKEVPNPNGPKKFSVKKIRKIEYID